MKLVTVMIQTQSSAINIAQQQAQENMQSWESGVDSQELQWAVLKV